MSKTLNDEQRQLVENNHNLIYSFLRSHNLSLEATEDWYGTAAIGLCKAALAYDETRGARFSTLAYLCMDREVKLVMRKERKCVKPSVSLDTELTNVDNGCYLNNIIPDTYDFMDVILFNDAVRIATANLCDRDKHILHLIMDKGYTQSKAAKETGLSQAQVSRIYHTYVDKIRDYFKD